MALAAALLDPLLAGAEAALVCEPECLRAGTRNTSGSTTAVPSVR